MNSIQQLAWYLGNQIPKINMKYDNVNRGGCGVFANIFHKELKRIGIDSEIILMDYKSTVANYQNKLTHELKEKINSTCNTTNDLNKNFNIQVCHIILKISDKRFPEQYYLDSSGISTDIKVICDYYEPLLTLTPEVLDRMASVPDGWNYMFNRDQIYYIECDINQMINEYDKKYNLLAA